MTASLPQFVLQFSAYMLILYLLEQLKVTRAVILLPFLLCYSYTIYHLSYPPSCPSCRG